MERVFLYEFVGRVMVYVGGARPPGDEQWDAYLNHLRRHVKAHPECPSIVWPGAAPISAVQRKQLADTMPKNGRTAVLSDSVVDRGIVTALSWFIDGIKAFPLFREDEALAHLQLKEDEAAAVLEAGRRLRSQMDRKDGEAAAG
jgi:hypothetical protein